MEWALASLLETGFDWNIAPLSLISVEKNFPKLSSFTLPINSTLLPKFANETTVLADDPPEIFFLNRTFF